MEPFPNEIALLIIEEIYYGNDKSTLQNLRQCSITMNILVIPMVYRKINVLSESSLEGCHNKFTTDSYSASWVRSIRIKPGTSSSENPSLSLIPSLLLCLVNLEAIQF